MSTIEQAYLHSIEISTQSITRDEDVEDVLLAKMRVNINRSRYLGEADGKANYDDSKSFWVNAEMWGPRVKHLEGIVEAGATLMLLGRYVNNEWNDDEGNVRKEIKLVVDAVALMPRCLVSVQYRSTSSDSQPLKND